MRYELIKVKYDDGYMYHFLQITREPYDNEEHIESQMVINEDEIGIINLGIGFILVMSYVEFDTYVQTRFF